MAKFFVKCGAPLEEDARVCGLRGALFAEGAVGLSEKPKIARLRVRRPRRWALLAAIAASALAVLAALSLILTKVNTPQRAAAQFLSALERGDFTALEKVARPADGTVVFSAERAAPMFRLYAERDGFRRTLAQKLRADAAALAGGGTPGEGGVVKLTRERRFLYTGYRVRIASCAARVSSPLLCTVELDAGRTLELSGDAKKPTDAWSVCGPDCALVAADGAYSAVIDGLLPGLYTLHGTVDTSFGGRFEARGELEVASAEGAEGRLAFAFVTLDVYNDSTVPVELYLGERLYCTVPPHCDGYLSPVHADTEVRAQAVVDGGEPMTRTFLAGDNDGYTCLAFLQCRVEIYNSYAIAFYVYRDGAYLQKVLPGSSVILSGLPAGTSLSVKLYEQDLMEPVLYSCEYASDYLCPSFRLTAENEADVDKAVRACVERAVAAFNDADAAALAKLPQSELREFLSRQLVYAQSCTEADPGYRYRMKITETDAQRQSGLQIASETASIPTITVSYEILYSAQEQYRYPGGRTKTAPVADSVFSAFTLRYVGGAWELIE